MNNKIYAMYLDEWNSSKPINYVQSRKSAEDLKKRGIYDSYMPIHVMTDEDVERFKESYYSQRRIFTGKPLSSWQLIVLQNLTIWEHENNEAESKDNLWIYLSLFFNLVVILFCYGIWG